jgi:hypothetical protein
MDLYLKILNSENWLQPDPISVHFAKEVSPAGDISWLSGEYWLSRFQKPTLSNAVPGNVRNLFEVARGTLAYGYFFYPLYTLGYEQLYRVAEAAVSEKCNLIGTPRRLRTFQDKIKFLYESNSVSGPYMYMWDFVRRKRNEASHPQEQLAHPPDMVASELEMLAVMINELFI